MKFDTRGYCKMLKENNISVLYSGPLWADGIDGMAEMLLKHFDFDNVPMSMSQAVFSIFVEQINNMMMYSAEKRPKNGDGDKKTKVPIGSVIIGIQDAAAFIQTENMVSDNSAKILKTRIDHLNTLNKEELHTYYTTQMKSINNNPESKGAGIGLIEIARRASGPIEYEFERRGDGLQYFTLCVKVEKKEEAA